MAMRRRKSDPVSRRSPQKQRRLSDGERRTLPPSPRHVGKVRQHTSLPLLHDFHHIYGIRGSEAASTTYEPGKYPWKPSQIQSLQGMVHSKEIVKLGALPYFRWEEETEFVMDEQKRGFFLYMASPHADTVKANTKQLKKDVGGTRHRWMHAHTPRLLELIFVKDPLWTGRYPSYGQGLDRVVNAWKVAGDVKSTIHSLRLLLLAIEYAYLDSGELNAVLYLGRLSPWETTDVHANQILPLFDIVNETVRGTLQPHDAYSIAKQLKQFYDKNKLSKVRSFLGKGNTLKMLHGFLQPHKDVGPMVTDNPDMLIAFRRSGA